MARRPLPLALTILGALLCPWGSGPAQAEVAVPDRLITGRPASTSFLEELLGQPWAEPLAPGGLLEAAGGRLRNLDLPWLPVRALAFSDHPERVLGRGLLFQGGLLGLRPVRFQYYHEGGREGGREGAPLWLSLRLIHRGARPARVHWVGAASEPRADYFQAGHENHRRFLERLHRFEGRVEELAPGEVRELALHPLPLNQVVSGTAQLTLLEGDQVGYQLFALHDPGERVAYGLLSNPRDVHARGIYPAADQELRRAWSPDQGEARVTLGAVRQLNTWPGPELKGDYGVVYKVRLDLSNPTPQTREVECLFNPRGGAAAVGLLLPDPPPGVAPWLEAPPTPAFAEVPLARFRLAPGERRLLELWTMPEGASNYPVRLIFRGLPAPAAEGEGAAGG